MFQLAKPDCLKEGLPGNAVIVDVRTGIEHKESCLSCRHIHMPLDQIDGGALKSRYGVAADAPVYLLCKGGTRARAAAGKLAAAGFTNMHVIDGGLMACREAGVATRAAPVALSLERQVRIAAGGLALAGFVLGALVNPVWHGLSGLIGGGLVFAGVTDRCGLALLLARAPWNRT